MKLKQIDSPSHKIKVEYKRKNEGIIVLDESEMAGGNRDFILRYRLAGSEVESGLLLHEREDENFFLLMMEPPKAPKIQQIPPREYVFIVDVSGSMNGFPLNISKRVLEELIGSLRPTDRFNVLLFAGGSQMLSPESLPATTTNIKKALKVIDNQKGGGGTQLLPALKAALKFKKTRNYSRTFVVLTDGYVSVEKEAFDLIRNNLNKANLIAFGIGSSVNRFIIEGMAMVGKSDPFIVTGYRESKKLYEKFKKYVSQPVLTNIQLEAVGVEIYAVEPVSIPDVFANRPIIVYGKYKNTQDGVIRLKGLAGDQAYVQEIPLTQANQENNQALRYLWARNKIKYLSDYGKIDKYGSSSEKIKKQVTNLGLKYNLLTEYTSFIAVDKIVRQNQGTPQKVDQPLPLPQGVSNLAVHGVVKGIVMSEDVKNLSEVVIVGYGKQVKRELTGSVTSVESRNIQETNLLNGLQGTITGVQVISSTGSPGGSAQVRIRGNSSITADNSPLIIIDGVIADNSSSDNGTAGINHSNRLQDLNPDEINSIEVLKGPSATAIFGARASKGVMIITTKEGHWGKAKMEWNSSFSINSVNRLPDLQNSFAQGRPVNGVNTFLTADDQESFSWGPSASSLGLTTYDPYDFWVKGVTLRNSFNISQGKDKWKYYFALGNDFENGIIPNTWLNRTNFNLNYHRQLSHKVNLNFSGFYTHTRGENAFTGASPSGVMRGILSASPTFDNGGGSSGRQVDTA